MEDRIMFGIRGNRSCRPAWVLLAVMTVTPGLPAAAEVSPENNPWAPTTEQVDARFQRVQREVDRLRAAGRAKEADRMAADLRHFRDQLAGAAPSRGTGPELHVVGTYDPGTVNVDVRPSDRPVILALTSYHQVNWNLTLQKGANLQKVLLYGYDKPIPPANLPKNVPVEVVNSGFTYGKDYGHYPFMAKRLHEITGLPVSSVQGQYKFDEKSPAVTVGSGGAEWNAQRVLSEMQPLYNQAVTFDRGEQRAAADAAYRFTALYHDLNDQRGMGETFVADFSPARAISKTLQPVGPRLKHVAVDPNGPTYYGLAHGSGPVQIDRQTGQHTDMPADNPELTNHPTGITFDTTRNRLVLSTLGGEGFLLTYDKESETWSPLTSLNQADLFSVTYSADDDALYALEHGGGIVRYTAEGSPDGTISLSEHIPQEQYAPWDYQLIAAGDRLILLTSPMNDLYEPYLTPQMKSYLIDPATGGVTILGDIIVAPEPGAATLLGFAGAALALNRRRRRRSDGARTVS
jgi:hypothetical protein